MDLETWDLHDPAALIHQLAERHPFRPGRVVVGLVQLTPIPQRLVESDVIWDADEHPSDFEAVRELVELEARRMVGTRPIARRPPDHTWITVVCRRGRVIMSHADFVWFYAWRYSNHLTGTFVGEYVGATEHGWRLWGTDLGAAFPRVEATSKDAARRP